MSADYQEEVVVLFHAALLGRTDVISKAISSIKAKCPITDEEMSSIISRRRAEDDISALHVAASFGHVDAVRALLHAGADLSVVPQFGDHKNKKAYAIATESAKQTFHLYLFEQVAIGDLNAIVRLLKGGLPVDLVDDSSTKDSTLHWASSFNNLEAAQQLLAFGCPVDTLNAFGQSSLHLACKNKNTSFVRLLLDEGANPCLLDTSGKCPLDMVPIGASNYEEIKDMLTSPPIPSLLWANKSVHELYDAADVNGLGDEMLLVESAIPIAIEGSASFDARDNMRFSADDLLGSLEEGATTDLELVTCFQAGVHGDLPELPLLVLWPPVQHQKRHHASPLVLRNSENILICVASTEIDIFPLLNWSGLMDTLDKFGFQAQVKRSNPGAKVRLCIDQNICPGRHRYEINIGPEQALLTASDATGLLYAVYTFVQLLQLHSEIRVVEGAETVVEIPSITISDWPDIPNRAVLWSYRISARTSASAMRETVELLSKLRLNMMFLVIDAAIVDPSSSCAAGMTGDCSVECMPEASDMSDVSLHTSHILVSPS
jgi:Ankyrin repeats (3 copies)/Ankyrin repeat